MNRYRFISLLFLGLSVSAMAQRKSMISLSLRDNIDYHHIDSAQIELLYQDSIKVAYKTLSQQGGNYQLEIDYRPGQYTLMADKKGYATGIKLFTISSYRASIVGLNTILLEKERNIRMKGVTVTSTRIKMVMRGDTIVYDAAAFDLAEGSMLDALVSQLPGAELIDGQIKVNGKVMESLLINGEDFFSGNPQIALSNLPSYSIKDIKVYNKASDDSYLKSEGRKMTEHEEHMVMDVRLKKKYMKGMIGNADLGYGLPGNRYMGKAFVMGYFRNTRITAFANLNNVKDTQIGTSGGNWDNGWNQPGELDLQMGGLDMSYKRNKLNYNGHLYLTREEPFVRQETSSVNYYNTGDVHGRSISETSTLRKHLITQHRLQYSGDRVYFNFSPMVDYLRDNNAMMSRQADFTESPDEGYRMEALDSLFAPSWTTSRYARMLLNRQARETDENKDVLYARAQSIATVKFPQLANDLLRIYAVAYYSGNTRNPAMTYLRHYGAASGNSGTGQRLLQTTDDNSKEYTLDAKIEYDWLYTPYQVNRSHCWSITPSVEVTRNYSDHKYTINRLMEQYSTPGQELPVLPPSAINPGMLALDRDNSYNSVGTQNLYKPSVQVKYTLIPSVTSGRQFSVNLNLTSRLQQEYLDYQKAETDTTVRRFSHIFTPTLSIGGHTDNSRRYGWWSLTYSYDENLPNINYQIKTEDSSDPNNIYRNHAHLKRPQVHGINFMYQDYRKTTSRNIWASATYSHTNRAIANAKRYDRDSGISIWTPENIDGNWNTSGSFFFATPLGKTRAFNLSTYTTGSFVHSVDYATETEELTVSTVDNLSLTEKLTLTYKIGKHVLSWSGQTSWLKSFSAREGFTAISAWNLSTGLNATLNLPANWQITSDISLLARTGYTDATLNTTHCYWNAAISKSILKGNLTFKLQAMDLLNQVSSVSRSINAQGQTETWTNSMTRYAMLHIIYKINKSPKQ